MSTTGAQVFAEEICEIGISDVFCITGAGNLALVDALRERGLKFTFFHSEQAAAMAAIGYYRACSSLPLVLVTTGAGTSNVLTGILSAYLDSVPMLVVSGNESSYHIESMKSLRAYGVQGFDSIATSKPISKASLRIDLELGIGGLLREAITFATEGRPGPVHIDFPMDLQRKAAWDDEAKAGKKLNLGSLDSDEITFENTLEQIGIQLLDSERPLVLIGQGVRNSGAAIRFLEKFGIPFSPSWSAFSYYADSHPLNVGRVGIYGHRAANFIVQNADFVLALGTRLSIPQVGYDREDFARKALRVVIDIDKSELSKFPNSYVTLHGNADTAIDKLLKLSPNKEYAVWRRKIEQVRQMLPLLEDESKPAATDENYVHSLAFIDTLNRVLDHDAIVSTDVGAGLLSGHYALQSTGQRVIFTSQGLGEMGFGLPGAIGAGIAVPERQLVCLNTDGGLMFNLQELETARHLNRGLKLVVFNNQGYGMIKISQGNLFGGREVGSGLNSGISFPDFGKLAEAFDFTHIRFDGATQERVLRESLNSTENVLIEVIMNPSQKYLPRLGTRKLADGSLFSPGLDDLDPVLDEATKDRILAVFSE